MFSQRLRELRIEHGLTQAELAKELNIGTSTVGMYESDIRKPSYEVLLKIANYFNVSTDYLVTDSLNNADDDFLIAFANKVKYLSPEQKEQVKSFINFLIHNSPK